jgi:hypothetical protein
MMSLFYIVVDHFASIDKCVLSYAAKIMANYANHSQKSDVKGKGKVGASGSPPAPILVPVPIPAASTGMNVAAAATAGIVPSTGEVPPTGKSVPSSVGTEVAAVPPKRRRITRLGKFFAFGS